MHRGAIDKSWNLHTTIDDNMVSADLRPWERKLLKIKNLHRKIEVEEMPISVVLRGALEQSIDNFIKTAKKSKMMYIDRLKAQDIEPNLEAILGYQVGVFYGIITGQYIALYDRLLNEEESIDVMNIIKRRMREIREACVDPR